MKQAMFPMEHRRKVGVTLVVRNRETQNLSSNINERLGGEEKTGESTRSLS